MGGSWRISKIEILINGLPRGQGGIDIRRVQMWLGHQTLQMTMRYAHLATNDLDPCVAVLDRSAAQQKPECKAGYSNSRGSGNGSPSASAEKQRLRAEHRFKE